MTVYIVQKVWGEKTPTERLKYFNNAVAVFFNETSAQYRVVELENKREKEKENCGFYYEAMETSDAPT